MSDDFVQRGKLLLQQREFAEVVKVCRTGLLTRPALVDGRLLLGTALLALRRYDEVLEEMRVAAEIARDHVLVHLLRGEAFLRKGEPEQAIETLAQAVELDPRNAVARKLYAEARHRAGLDAMPVPAAGEAPAETIADEAAQAGASTRPDGAPARRPRSRRTRILLFAAAALLIVGAAGAATTVLVRRSMRGAERRGTLREQAGRALAEQTYAGYVHAAQAYARAAADGDAPSRGLEARVRAAAAFELGVRLPGERPPSEGRDAEIVAVYDALAGGDVAEALRQAASLEEGYRDDPEAAYLAGRARLILRQPGAAESLRRSAELAPRPLTLTALGDADATGGRIDDALKDFDAALALVPGHPSATVARARALAAAGRLPPADDPAAPDRVLARFTTAEAVTAHGDAPPALSPAQQQAAALALAEVKLARGDAAGARAAVAVLGEEPVDVRFGEVLVAAQLAAGDVAGARAEAEKWKAALPASSAPHAWLARVALAEDNLEAARVALAEAGDGETSFAAMVARGELELSAGNLDAAAEALDGALAQRAGDRAALALRARVDLERGDAATAEARVSAAYDASKDPVLAWVLGEALRRRGARPRARSLLEEASLRLEASSGRPSTVAAVAQSLARLHHEEGRYADAEHEIGRALALRPQDVPARLLAAQVHHDLDDMAQARADVDTLAVAAHTMPDVLLLAARIHTAGGDLGEAKELLDEAARLPTAPALGLLRERARVALAGGRAREAVEMLARGGALPDDGEACLLLVEARLALEARRNERPPPGLPGVEAIVADVARKYAGAPEEGLARGRLQLARSENAEAAASFTTAAQRLEAAAAPPRLVAEARVLAGEALDAAARPVDALAAYRDAVRVAPASSNAAIHLGRALAASGDAAGAFDVLAQSVKTDPGVPDAQFYLGEVAAGLKKTAPAKQALEAYLKLAPTGANADKARKLLGQL